MVWSFGTIDGDGGVWVVDREEGGSSLAVNSLDVTTLTRSLLKSPFLPRFLCPRFLARKWIVCFALDIGLPVAGHMQVGQQDVAGWERSMTEHVDRSIGIEMHSENLLFDKKKCS